MKSKQLGDAPIQDEYREQMNMLAHFLDKIFNGEAKSKDRKTGFVLLVFPFKDNNGRTNYISNGANRQDICTLFREQIARFEEQPEQKGNA